LAKIDLDKLQNAFKALHQTDEGRNGMLDFRVALDSLRSSIKSNVNDAEFLYMLRSIVEEISLEDYSKTRARTKGAASAELSDKDLDQVAGGALNTTFTPRIQQFGQVTTFPDLGFQLRGVI
jgi:hypothetical protein